MFTCMYVVMFMCQYGVHVDMSEYLNCSIPCTGAREAAFRNIKSIAECLADELINAAKVGVSVTRVLLLCLALQYYGGGVVRVLE